MFDIWDDLSTFINLPGMSLATEILFKELIERVTMDLLYIGFK